MEWAYQIFSVRVCQNGDRTRRLRFALAIANLGIVLFTLSACVGRTLPDDLFDGEGKALSIVPVNHTDRYAMNVSVGKYWAGDVSAHGGGGSAACCFPGVKDWSRAVSVKWTWGTEEDTRTKAVAKPAESHIVTAHFPLGGPHSDTDEYTNDAYLCVILRDLDAVDLAFSPSAFACADK
ncbi:hypothetical protein BG58_21295 [Caballeronia jiangsuensis]|nr:hypothetical protein BG58_21295 [Caballeronia jiangsuensis]